MMRYLDDLAFRLLGPGYTGATLLIALLLLVMVGALVLVLPSLVSGERTPAAARQQRPSPTGPKSAYGKSRRRSLFAEIKPGEAPPAQDDADVFYKGSRMEKRAGGYRRPGNPVPVHILEGEDADAVELGWINDRSSGGLGLEMDREVPVETILRVRPTTASITTPWVEVEVRNCRLVENRYHIGTQFVRKPSGDVMMAFG